VLFVDKKYLLMKRITVYTDPRGCGDPVEGKRFWFTVNLNFEFSAKSRFYKKSRVSHAKHRGKIVHACVPVRKT
jgi:hypothetical protein